jgi:hypothetical protein
MPTASNTSTLPQEVERLQVLVTRYRAVAQENNRRLAELVSFERAYRGLGDGESTVCSGQEMAEDAASRRAASVVARLAAREFAVAGATLSIPEDSLPDLEPAALWRQLEVKFGGDGAAGATYDPVARDLGNLLWVKGGEEMRVVGGRLSHRIWIDYDQPYGPHMHSRTKLTKLVEAMRVVGEWSGTWAESEKSDAAAILALLSHQGHYSGNRALLQRMKLGAVALIVPTMSSWEFRFSFEFAERMQLFIAEFGPEESR